MQVLLTLLLIAVGLGIGKAAAGELSLAWGLPYVASGTIALVWTYRLVRRAERRAGTGRGQAPTPWTDFWRFTSPRAMQSIVQIGLQRLGIVLVSATLGPAHAAVYAAVTRFLVFGQLGSQAITAAVQPQIGALMVKDDHKGAQHIYQVSTCWLVLLCWPVYLFLAVFSRQIPLIFGPGYDAGTAVLVVLAGAMLFATGSGMVDAVLAMAGKTLWTLMNATIALIVNVSLTLVLLPHLGILGAAIGWAVGIVTNNVLPLTQLAVSMRLHPFGRGTLLAMAVAAVWLGALPLLVAVATHDGLVALIVSFGVGLVGYGLTSWRLSGVLELDALVRATRRRPRGPEAGPHGRHGGSGTSGDDGTSGGDGKGGRHVVPLPAVGPR
jgi:O-antigen/teichoic acid export membrane protein